MLKNIILLVSFSFPIMLQKHNCSTPKTLLFHDYNLHGWEVQEEHVHVLSDAPSLCWRKSHVIKMHVHCLTYKYSLIPTHVK
jgi:hypothetical protein